MEQSIRSLTLLPSASWEMNMNKKNKIFFYRYRLGTSSRNFDLASRYDAFDLYNICCGFVVQRKTYRCDSKDSAFGPLEIFISDDCQWPFSRDLSLDQQLFGTRSTTSSFASPAYS